MCHYLAMLEIIFLNLMLHICPAIYFYMEKQYLAFEHAFGLLHVWMLGMA
jgi:hypothetical protein